MKSVLDDELTGERSLFREMVRDFAAGEIAPRAGAFDEEARFPAEVLQAMGPLGLLGIPIPEAYGGAGADLLDYMVAMEEISAACASTGLTLAAHTSLATMPILVFGTEEQKKKYLPDLASGRKLGAFCLTEPQAGSDAAGLTTAARPKDGRYVLDGTKVFITNGSYADLFLVAARTGPAGEKGGTRGISAFIVGRALGGISVGRVEEKLGMRGSDTAEIVFQGTEVPAENLLGTLDDGFSIFLHTLTGGRIGIGSMGVGIARAAL